MMIQSNVYILLSNWALAPDPSPLTHALSTTVESALQNHLFMQNEPNSQKTQMNVNAVITTNYEQRTMNYEIKNEPNQSQF